ncbi:hypothetical protein Dimus_001617 [Dionaea muscipula]
MDEDQGSEDVIAPNSTAPTAFPTSPTDSSIVQKEKAPAGFDPSIPSDSILDTMFLKLQADLEQARARRLQADLDKAQVSYSNLNRLGFFEAVKFEKADTGVVKVEAANTGTVKFEAADIEVVEVEVADTEVVEVEAADTEAVEVEAVDTEAVEVKAADTQAVELEAVV